MSKELKDRYGNEVSVGANVIFCMYDRNSELYTGDVLSIGDKNILIRGPYSWQPTRRVKIKDVERNLIVNKHEK